MNPLPEKIIVSPAELAARTAKTLRICEADLGSPLKTDAPLTDCPTTNLRSPDRLPTRALLSIVGALAAATIVFVIYYARWQREGVEDLAAGAERSVVQVRCADMMGTGTVVAANATRALILTNRHVLATAGDESSVARRSEITLPSGQVVAGRVIGWAEDAELDLALIIAPVANLEPFTSIANFTALRKGQRVIAIGHPLGLEYTVTEGIISAKRDGLWIQTTAAINTGNSGGPLVGLDGSLLGINTLLVDQGSGATYGFALRADYVKRSELWKYTEDVSDLLNRISIRHAEAN
jgi:S1-C subfamily serine protease